MNAIFIWIEIPTDCCNQILDQDLEYGVALKRFFLRYFLEVNIFLC